MNRIIGIIPARFASVRFPGKVLAPLHGRPLIAWVVERVQQASCLAEVYVATDDERVRQRWRTGRRFFGQIIALSDQRVPGFIPNWIPVERM